MTTSHTEAHPTQPRRNPRQARSIERVNAILGTAAELISEKGIDNTTMSAIARASNMSLASLYRYFPNKSAIIHAIAERHVEQLDQLLREHLPVLDFESGLDHLIDLYARFYRHEPGYKEIWSGVEGMPELRALDQRELFMNARELHEASQQLLPDLDEKRRWLVSMLLPRTCGSILRLATTLPEDQASSLVEELKVLVRTYLTSLSQKP